MSTAQDKPAPKRQLLAILEHSRAATLGIGVKAAPVSNIVLQVSQRPPPQTQKLQAVLPRRLFSHKPPATSECNRSASYWSVFAKRALRVAVSQIRPSEANYWHLVAARVGKSADECQRFVAEGQHANEAKPKKRARRSAGIRTRSRGGDMLKENVDPLCTIGPIPNKEGPRRAKRVRALLNAQSFGSRDCDFLSLQRLRTEHADSSGDATTSSDVGAVILLHQCTATQVPAAAAHSNNLQSSQSTALKHELQNNSKIENQRLCEVSNAAPETESYALADEPSPASKMFLDSLHTGLTPDSKHEREQSNIWSNDFRRCLFDEFEDAPDLKAEQDTLDLGDGRWEPKGLDSFICEVRARRGRLPLLGSQSSKASEIHSSKRARQHDPLRASQLLKQVEGQDQHIPDGSSGDELESTDADDLE